MELRNIKVHCDAVAASPPPLLLLLLLCSFRVGELAPEQRFYKLQKMIKQPSRQFTNTVLIVISFPDS